MMCIVDVVDAVHIHSIVVDIIEGFIQKLGRKDARAHFDAIAVGAYHFWLYLLAARIFWQFVLLILAFLFRIARARFDAFRANAGARFGAFEKFIAQLNQFIVVHHGFLQIPHTQPR